MIYYFSNNLKLRFNPLKLPKKEKQLFCDWGVALKGHVSQYQWTSWGVYILVSEMHFLSLFWAFLMDKHYRKSYVKCKKLLCTPTKWCKVTAVSSWLPLVNENKVHVILLVTVFKSKMYTKLKCVLNLHNYKRSLEGRREFNLFYL